MATMTSSTARGIARLIHDELRANNDDREAKRITFAKFQEENRRLHTASRAAGVDEELLDLIRATLPGALPAPVDSLGDSDLLDAHQADTSPRAIAAGREVAKRIRQGSWTLGG